MSDAPQHKACSAIKEAWQKVYGMKLAFWGGLSVLSLVSLGGTTLLALILFFGQMTYMPHLMQIMHTNMYFFLDPKFIVPVGMLGCFLVYHIAQTLFQSIILLPMFMGLRLVALRRVADKCVSACFTLKFFTWKYIFRFIMLEVLIVLMIGIPLGLGFFLAYAPTLFLFTHAFKIASHVVSGLFFLYALYLIVSYAFINLIVIDRNLSAWQSMELSRKTITKRWFCMFGALIWIVIVVTAGTLCLFIGLIWAIPYAQCFIAILYREMIGIEGQDPVTQCELKHSK